MNDNSRKHFNSALKVIGGRDYSWFRISDIVHCQSEAVQIVSYCDECEAVGIAIESPTFPDRMLLLPGNLEPIPFRFECCEKGGQKDMSIVPALILRGLLQELKSQKLTISLLEDRVQELENRTSVVLDAFLTSNHEKHLEGQDGTSTELLKLLDKHLINAVEKYLLAEFRSK